MSKVKVNDATVFLHSVFHGMSLWPIWVWILVVPCVLAGVMGYPRSRNHHR